MKLLLQEIGPNPLLWLLVFVPIALAAEKLNHEAHTLHFVLSVFAILPLAVLLSHATESVAAKRVASLFSSNERESYENKRDYQNSP